MTDEKHGLPEAVEVDRAASSMPVPASTAAPPDVAALLHQAIESGVGVEALEKLVALQERIMDRQAEAEYGAAKAAFQAEQKPIEHDARVNIGARDGQPYGYSFASLAHIAEVIRPCLAKHGLSYSFDTELTPDSVKATCILQHRAGHKERHHFTAPLDPRASMSDPQKAASATTYAQRYALRLALGLTTRDKDDDGHAAGSVPITPEQAKRIRALIAEVGADEAKFLVYMRASAIEQIPAASFDLAIGALEARRKKDQS